MITLKDWQKEAISAIESTLNKSGIVEGCVGSGKTIIGLSLIEKYKQNRFLIVVPTVVLLNQWKREIIKFNVANEDEISLIGGGNKYDPTKRITIAVVNSLRNVNWNHSLAKFDNVVCDECFTGDTKIKVIHKNGCRNLIRETPIRELVRQKKCKKIITFNTITKEFEIKNIKNWFKLKDKRDIYKIVFENDEFIECTENQEFYVLDKYIKVKDLSIGDNVIYFGKDNKLLVNDDIKQLVISGILGDGNISIHKKGARIRFNCVHREYIEYKKDILSIIENDKHVDKKINKGYKINDIYVYVSCLHKDLLQFYNEYKQNGIKFLLNQLDDMGLALWLYDDASFSGKKYKNCGILHSNRYTKEENEIISEWFNSKGFKSKLYYNKTRNCYGIRFNKDSAIKLIEIMKKYPFKCFNYKTDVNKTINKELKYKRNIFFNVKSLDNISIYYKKFHMMPSISKIKNIIKTGIKEQVYDIEVEDNHNFFANGRLVHNCHRYASNENIKFLENNNFVHKLGLSATLSRPDGKDSLLIKNIGPILYRLTMEDAKDLDYVADYDLTLSKVQLDKEEAEKYIIVENNVRMYMSIFNNNYKLAQTLVSKRNFRHALYRDAVKLVKYIQERKSFLVNVKSKKDKAIELVTMNIGKKIILFDELSDSANEIYRRLQNLGLNPVIYHSGIGKKEKTEAINKFTSGESTILVSVKALDEGMDVKDADVGIIVNGNRQERQIKQRLGRILRKKDDKKAMLYMLYVENTQDSKTMLNRMQYIKTADNIYYE
jgi:superfamily II DNA or RNA helicase